MSEPIPSLSVLVVTWNSSSTIDACLESILAHESHPAPADPRSPNVEIVVVDNASTDDTWRRIRHAARANESIRCHRNETNRGFSAAVNQAYALARADTIAVLNPDVVLLQPTLLPLARYLDTHPEAGLVTCTLRTADGEKQWIHRALPTLGVVFFALTAPGRLVDARLFGGAFRRRYRASDLPAEPVVRLEQAAGALAVLRRETVARLGALFDERFPLLGSDVDLARRLADLGLQTHLVQTLEARHVGSVSLGQLPPAELRRMKRHWLRAYYRVHEPWWRRALLRLLLPWTYPASERERLAVSEPVPQ